MRLKCLTILAAEVSLKTKRVFNNFTIVLNVWKGFMFEIYCKEKIKLGTGLDQGPAILAQNLEPHNGS